MRGNATQINRDGLRVDPVTDEASDPILFKDMASVRDLSAHVAPALWPAACRGPSSLHALITRPSARLYHFPTSTCCNP